MFYTTIGPKVNALANYKLESCLLLRHDTQHGHQQFLYNQALLYCNVHSQKGNGDGTNTLMVGQLGLEIHQKRASVPYLTY